ncbi:MAG: hypothetical protein JW741_03670 [Sedimentisphaerales bacterium]|nr:hypothetical protein [Sedimentisphaerales bacterium]
MTSENTRDLQEAIDRLRDHVERVVPLAAIAPSLVRTLHHDAIHEIRRFSAEGYFQVKIDKRTPYLPYENLANACRSAMAAVTKSPARDIHCAIKRCGGERGGPPADWRVWTFAASTIESGRPDEFGPDCYRLIGENSAFASLVGCKDRKTEWGRYSYRCFGCNDLTEYSEYDDSDDDWSKWYKSALVYPIRYERASAEENDKPHDFVFGFLAFDSLNPEVFSGIPAVFEYVGQPVAYHRELNKSDVYHAGGIIADTIALGMIFENRIQRIIERFRRKNKDLDHEHADEG